LRKPQRYRLGLHGTGLPDAAAGTIRLKRLKLGALTTLSVRRIEMAITPAYPQPAPGVLLTPPRQGFYL